MNERPDMLVGITYKLDLDHISEPIFLTVNHRKLRNKTYLHEIFINCSDPKQMEWIPVASRLLSAVFRNGGDIEFIFKELKEMFSYETFYYKGIKYHSIIALIGEILEKHNKQLNSDKDTWE